MASNTFNLQYEKHVPKIDIPLPEQRKRWFREFLKPYSMIIILYSTMYLIRNNFKAAQPLMKSQLGFTTAELGTIGFVFSLVYGFGKIVVAYLVANKDTKKMVSLMLFFSSIVVIAIGCLFTMNHVPMGWLLVLWALNGACQCAGGPSCCNVISGWTTKKSYGRYTGVWNASHNIGSGLAGIFALWCAQTFAHGHVAGMFIIPAIVAMIIAVISFFIGKNRPEDLGWASPEEIFDEPLKQEDVESKGESTWFIFRKYLLGNPWVWILCLANVFVYLVRIGIDNWAPLRVVEELHFTTTQGALTITYFEAGALIGCLMWGFISDFIGGRPGLVATVCAVCLTFAMLGYQYGKTPTVIYVSLFFLGMFVFGPQLLIPVTMLNLIPKKANVLSGGLSGAFAYLFGDSTAKVLLGRIADSTKSGLNIFGHVLHGWNDTFSVLYVAIALSVILLAVCAITEERKTRAAKRLAA
ncbi:hexose-6-phosphate:phosphate antiporter [Bifidobacterium sp. ESL0763]|uniref:hexose-6-phosphate:phosphate antiporter n=1 Tax=Bifidobacterium sp. ESL0763 TaxID=2983227 RepID=UPI0023F823A0|nr:hexose-6-phosphate:phosphate antiporter [Bifidobacterium sp. ESL0763]MDF7663924.1 hexose-6-phosphate:phosphate antiporter [Bifidobacterium sp. ESL0763]